MFGKIFTYIFYTILVVLILFYGVKVTKDITRLSEEFETKNFVNSLKNDLAEYSELEIGSKKEVVYSIGKNIIEVCFVDESKKFDQFVNQELNVKIKLGYNLFLDEQVYNLNFQLNETENPLCIKPVDGKINLKLETKKEKVEIAALENKKIDCTVISYNKNPNENIDIVFLANNYKKISDFVEDANLYYKEFISVEPVKSSIEKFNFYRIDDLKNLNCKIEEFIRCDEFRIKEIASQCPNDYIFILTKRSRLIDFVEPVRSSAISNLIKVNTADNRRVLLHEFGHVFANLADEYVDEEYYRNLPIRFDEEDYANCDIEPCEEWSIITTGCYKGCSLSYYNRPTKNSIMRDYSKTKDFGPVNEVEINRSLNLY